MSQFAGPVNDLNDPSTSFFSSDPEVILAPPSTSIQVPLVPSILNDDMSIQDVGLLQMVIPRPSTFLKKETKMHDVPSQSQVCGVVLQSLLCIKCFHD